MDTDAAGIWHHSTAIRWIEEAEAELHRGLGVIDETFGLTPRVHIDLDFLLPLEFDDEVEVTLEVGEVGETSVEYLVTVYRLAKRAASGRMVAVLIDDRTRRPRPWPDHLRATLTGSAP